MRNFCEISILEAWNMDGPEEKSLKRSDQGMRSSEEVSTMAEEETARWAIEKLSWMVLEPRAW